MVKINKVKMFSLAKFQAVLFALLGLIAGILYSFGGLVIDTLVSLDLIRTNETPGLSEGTILAFGALIGMPLIFSVSGFALGLVQSVLYNIYAKSFGGINLKFE